MESWVKVKDLEKQIDNFKLGPVNMSIEPGTITALVGSNGSGKSTYLKLLMNLVKPDLGWVKMFNNHVGGTDEDWKKHVAYQPQIQIGYDDFTGYALKNLISYWYPNWDESLFESMVHEFDVPVYKRFGSLSEGAKQKLKIALTIPRNAELLLLDEPTSFLDIPAKKKLIDLLVEWMDQGERAIILASHQSDDIKRLADYIAVLKRGKLLGVFEKEQLTESFKRFWLHDNLPAKLLIPGELLRDENSFVTNQQSQAEKFLTENNILLIDRTTLDFDEIITLMLTNKSK